ncbi:Druantia anti-phage system protein DruA [Vibrio alginolyticus]|uniref:Druantia anti-phage system protein DruA n=1 Tax=Vibrio alginolyticus TaxID=663 RepID=UPI00397F97F1
MSKSVVSVNLKEAQLKRKLREHLHSLGFTKSEDGSLLAPGNSKEVIRSMHQAQRKERLEASRNFIVNNYDKLLGYFASGSDIVPERISPVLERVDSKAWSGDLFRLASLTWSVPVSNGFGRRLRYLVWDESNGKLMGLIAIGDPVFNLAVRDNYIGWNTHDRSDRLVNVMDAYVLGAIPPYNSLLCGKLIASLLRTQDLYNDFSSKYGSTTGVISKSEKKANLLAVTTSSSMGRSSVYNRVRLNNTEYLKSLGYTGGWGHFHIPEWLFKELREYLREKDHRYADQYSFGQGPNWRLRATKAALSTLGFKADLLKHGIQREVFISQLAENSLDILRTGQGVPDISNLKSSGEVAESALQRWVIPRAAWDKSYLKWNSSSVTELLGYKTKQLIDKKNIA